jgi:hypothetical protein
MENQEKPSKCSILLYYNTIIIIFILHMSFSNLFVVYNKF